MVQIDVASTLACALRRSGEVLCWDTAAKHSVGFAPGSRAPKKVESLRNVQQVALLVGGLCSLGRDGTVSCLGLNVRGQLGRGKHGGPASLEPARVQGLGEVVQLSAGNFSVCALQQDGAAWCWGANASAQLGDGTVEPRLSPVRLLL